MFVIYTIIAAARCIIVKQADIDVFVKDKNEYSPKLYNLPEFQELLEYIKSTL